ncbi:hypothetical protein NDU88_008993 [Pleurodeles waltl]|uniref:EGF-like domain-containing protein n=1 Tax=Pleurodeles waltl TaxID=8319 RepID=A0AAV7RU04_PLEWA|nr:hypothetical protein NDU88_008993 [Pleurodeles waltl]
MRLFLLLLFAFSQAFFPFSLADRLSGELFSAVFHNNQNGEFQKTDANSALQKAMQQNPELAQNSLSFVPGENCHSIMMEDSGKFSLSMNVSNTNSNIWCNWIIWAGPGRRILVNITGFKSNEDCAKNQDVIIFHAIASTAESTVIYACWNKSIHSFSARALALNVVYMSGRSSQMDESGYFNGTYSLYEDYERSNLKYPLLSSPVAKEKGWHHNSGENKTSSGRLLVSTIAATSVPMIGRYTGNINPTSHMASSLSFPTTSWKKTTYRREQFLSPLRPTKNSKGARSSTDGAVTSRKGDQILMAVPTKRTTAKDGGVNMQGITESSSVPKTMWHFMTTKHQAKSLITLNAHTSSEENGGYVTSTNIPPFPNVKQTIPAKKIYQLYNSSSPVSENSYIEAEIIEQGSGIIKNDSYEKGLRFTTESNNLNQVTNISKSKQTFSMEKPVGKDGALTSSQMQDALSRTVTMHVGVSVAPKKVHQSAFRGYSITARSIPRGNPLVSTSQAPYSEMVITTKTVQQTPFKDQQISSDSKTIQYSKSFQEELNMFSLEYKYGPSAYTYDNGASPEKDPITKSAFFIKARKNKKKRPFFKPRRKNRRKNLEMGDKNNSEPIFLEFSKSNPAATPPVRVVKALKTDTSVAAENIDPQSRDSKSPPPIHESTLQLSGFPSASGLLIEKHIATLGSPNITTLEGRQQEDPFGAVAVAVSNNSGLQNQHKPGDSLFTLILVIDYQDILPEKGQNMDLLQSIMETIKEHILDPSSQLNEIKLQHFQRTTKIRAVLSFWIHLKHGGKDLHTFKSQLKKFESTSLGNGKYVPVSFSIEDINECESGLEYCDENAECHNEIGAYTCLCRDGYEDHSADALGTECVLSQPSGIGPFFSYVEILLGSLLGVILLLVLAVVVSCVLVRKRQVERTIDLSVAKDLAAQPDRPRPSFVHMSMESENVTHRVFPVVKLTTAEGQATSKRLSDVTTVTLEKSACL